MTHFSDSQLLKFTKDTPGGVAAGKIPLPVGVLDHGISVALRISFKFLVVFKYKKFPSEI